MKKILCFFIVVSILLTGCTQQPNAQRGSEDQDQYNTILSKNGELSIVTKPENLYINRGVITKMPKYYGSEKSFSVDIRSGDLTKLDLSNNYNDLMHADFDSKTQWPSNLPEGFDPQEIMELGSNPGLGLYDIHKKGITGKGIGIAIIDGSLLVDHIEYKDQLKLYEEIHLLNGDTASMHGPAVASIAVGKTVGVAPEADLYYIACTHAVYKEEGGFEFDLKWYSKSIDRIIEINRTLPNENKIRVISISFGIKSGPKGMKNVLNSIKRAEKEGIHTVFVGSNKFSGLGRDPLKSADNSTSFTEGKILQKLIKTGYESSNEHWKNQIKLKYGDSIFVPMDSRCFASPTGNNDYVFNRIGGCSWTVPYVAGLYALACQVNENVTPETFWKEASNTADILKYNNEEKLGLLVNPKNLLEKIEKLK
jgi:subtilase family protein